MAGTVQSAKSPHDQVSVSLAPSAQGAIVGWTCTSQQLLEAMNG